MRAASTPKAFTHRASAPLARILLVCALIACPGSASAQLPDAFAAHFGGTRRRESGPLESFELSSLLLTQYDSRWDPDFVEVLQDFDDLAITAGYNYIRYGRQYSNSSGPGFLVSSWSVLGGFVSDGGTQKAQNALHRFLRFPFVQRDLVASDIMLAGAQLDGGYWRDWHFQHWSFSAFSHGTFLASTQHNDLSLGGGGLIEFWKLRAHADATFGALVWNGSVEPAEVAMRLKDGYTRVEGYLEVDRNRYGSGASYFPGIGVGLLVSTGLFPDESEKLLSVFLDLPTGRPNDTFRFEFVNDLIGGKDRGPTGGLRLAYVARP
jgi:hypothetical protein